MATADEVEQVRRFNRTVTQRVGVLNDHYLGRDRPLGESRVLWEVGPDGRDIRSLEDHVTFLSNKINFLLDATLGMISTEQNQIIKLFSVMAVVLLPPTLIASIYGMNFRHMPELDWALGYPWALGLMVIAAIVPVVYFRRKGWL